MSKNKFKVVITDLGYQSYDLEKKELAGLDVNLILAECSNEDEVSEICKDADGVIVRMAPVGEKAINAMEKCKVISRYGVGVDNVNVKSATNKNIIVAHVRNYCNEDVSDHAFALLMACIRKVSHRDRQVRSGMWDIGAKNPVYRVKGKTLGLIGYGGISRTLHRKFSGFDLGEVLVFDPFVSAEEIRKYGARKVEVSEIIEKADFISIHAPLTKETFHMIGESELKAMKSTAILVNTSRGPLVDSKALYNALKTGEINSAGLDVHEVEPPLKDYNLFELDNVILTDHCGWYTEESQGELQRTAAKNVALVLKGENPLYCVNPKS
jgi:D-3-phosphoglycerate dehydrogenase